MNVIEAYQVPTINIYPNVAGNITIEIISIDQKTKNWYHVPPHEIEKIICALRKSKKEVTTGFLHEVV